jgi:DNA-binding IclR family transcriptional regulator
MIRNQKLKVANIIDLLTSSPRPLTSQQIAESLYLDTSTTNRLLNSMATDGLIKKDKKTRAFYPAAKSLFPMPLNHPVNTTAEKIWAVVLQLRNSWSLTAGFVYFYGGERVLCALAVGSDPLTSQYDTILKSPLHASGSGKLFLAAQSTNKWKTLLGPEPLEKFTSTTTISIKDLQAEIKAGLDQGYITCKDDYVEGFTVVSGPVTFSDRIVGCFFVSGRTQHIDSRGAENIGLSIKKQVSLFQFSNPTISYYENLYL